MRFFRLVAGMLIVLVALSPLAMPRADARGDEAQQLVQKINALRASKGVAPLQVDAELTAIGQRWAAHMSETGQVSHNPDFPNQVRQAWTKLAENVGADPYGADSIHNAFVRSSSHYQNLVDPELTHVGIGAVWVDDVLWVAEQFMRLEGRAAPAPPPPRSEPTQAPVPAPAGAPAPAPDLAPAASTPARRTPAAPLGSPTPVPARPSAEETEEEARVERVLAPLRALDAR